MGANVYVDERTGLQKVTLRAPSGSTAEVYCHGAHVTSWKTVSGEEMLFLSDKAVFKPPKAIRGGIPVCFPQFGGFGPLAQHGFARTSEFMLVDGGSTSVTLSLQTNEGHLKLFPHPFELTVTVSIGDEELEQTLEAKNTGDKPFELTAALHTYIAVSSIDKASVKGLKGVEYMDSLQDKKRMTEEQDRITFTDELDRIYLQTPDTLQVVDEGKKRVVKVEKEGFPDAVLWNPWIKKAAGMADFGDEEYKGMVCLEPAVAGSGPVTLEPGKTWTAKQTLSVRHF